MSPPQATLLEIAMPIQSIAGKVNLGARPSWLTRIRQNYAVHRRTACTVLEVENQSSVLGDGPRYPTRPDVPRRQTHSCFSPNHCIGARHWMDRRRGYRPARDSPRLRPTFHDCNRVHSGWCCGAAHIIRQLDPVLRSYKELRLRARRSHRSRRCCFGP